MTKEQFNERFEALLEDGYIEKFIREKKEHFLLSGAVDLESMPNDYSLAKDVLSVCLERLARQYSAIGCGWNVQRESKKRIKNIRYFI